MIDGLRLFILAMTGWRAPFAASWLLSSRTSAPLRTKLSAWVDKTEPGSVFYYRIQSPVILIEFDHQSPIALRHLESGTPTREHIHSVVRTPNGNDYGKDLLRQHYQKHPHPHQH